MDPTAYFQSLGFNKIFSFLTKIALFYSKPKTFFQWFIALNPKEKLLFAIFIVTTSGLFIFIVAPYENTRSIATLVFFDVIAVGIGFFPLWASNSIISKLMRVPFHKGLDLFYYLVICKFLYFPILIIVLIIFHLTEYYPFYYLMNYLWVFYALYITAFVFIVIYNGAKVIVVAISINFLLINLLTIPMFFIYKGIPINVSETVLFNPDRIRIEMMNTGRSEDFKLFTLWRVQKAVIGNKEYNYYALRENGIHHITPVYIGFNGEYQTFLKYKEAAESAFNYYDSIIPTLQYQTCIQYYSKVQDYFASILQSSESIEQIGKEDAIKTKPICLGTDISIIDGELFIYQADNSHYQRKKELENDIENYGKKIRRANYPYYIGNVYGLAWYYLAKKYGSPE